MNITKDLQQTKKIHLVVKKQSSSLKWFPQSNFPSEKVLNAHRLRHQYIFQKFNIPRAVALMSASTPNLSKDNAVRASELPTDSALRRRQALEAFPTAPIQSQENEEDGTLPEAKEQAVTL